MNGKYFAAILSSMFPRVMLSRITLNRTSTAVCDAVRARLHAVRDVDHRDAGQDRGEEQVQDRLVDVQRPRQVDPGVER